MKKMLAGVLSLILLSSACGDGSEYAAKVGKSKISASELQFYLESVKSEMEGTELSSEEDWQEKEIEGRKAIDLARERALDTAVNNVAYIEVAKAMGIKLSDSDRDTVDRNKDQFVSLYGGEDAYKDFLEANGISDDFIDMLCESMIYSSKLTERLSEEDPVTDEDISAYFSENEAELSSVYRRAKHVLILTKNMETGEELSAEEQEAARVQAEDIYNRALAGEDFDALVAEYSQDPGSETNPDGYVFGDGEMVQEFQDGVDALAPGEIGLVKSDFGYHVIKRLPLEESGVADRIESIIMSQRLEERMESWENEYEIEVEINTEVVSAVQ